MKIKHKDIGEQLTKAEWEQDDIHLDEGDNVLEIIVKPGDDDIVGIGDDNDIAILLRSAILLADTALDNVLIGSPSGRLVAPNSAIFSNIAEDGDFAFYGNAGGNSQQFMLYDSSNGILYFAEDTIFDATVRITGYLSLSESLRMDNDDKPLYIGGNLDFAALLETHDANARMLLLGAPHVSEDANNVAVVALVDYDAIGTDLGAGGIDLSGITEPTLAIGNEATDAYVSLDAGDAVGGAGKGLYFKVAADEDFDIFNSSVGGNPRVYWDESLDMIRSTHGIYVDDTATSIRIDGGLLINNYGKTLNFLSQFTLQLTSTDTDARIMKLLCPTGGAALVPVMAQGLAGINVDLGTSIFDFAGYTEPTYAIFNAASDAAVTLDAGDVNGSGKGLYFKAAADEDVNILLLSNTGSPKIFWDESADKFDISHGIDVGGAVVASVFIAGAGGLQSSSTSSTVIARDATGHGWDIYTTGAAATYTKTLRFNVTGTVDSAVVTWSAVGSHIMGAAYMQLTEISAPGAGAANTARIYALEGAGDVLTDLCAVFQDGSIDVFAQETTEPDSPIFQFPDSTNLRLTMRKPDRKTVQFVATFPNGRDFVIREIRYPVERW